MNDFKKPVSKKQIVGSLFLAVVFIFIMVSINKNSSNAPAHTLSDKQKFTKFCHSLMRHATTMDNLYKPFMDAAQERNLLDATKIALNIKDQIHTDWTAMYNMEVPALSNAAAETALKDAKEKLATAYFCKNEVIKNFLAAADNPTMQNMAKMSNSADQSEDFLILGTAKFMEAGTDLGLKPDEITAIMKQ